MSAITIADGQSVASARSRLGELLSRPEHLFLVALILTSSILPILFARPGTPLWLVFLLQLLFIPLAVELSELFGAALLSEVDLPRLEILRSSPRVAVLLLISDDVVPEAVERLTRQTYPFTSYFVLDDSRKPANHPALADPRLNVVRRGSRVGFKAGNLNNWVRCYGRRYDYFVVLDSDSILTPDFVEQALLYAEHTSNSDVAIFNSVTENWNEQSRFSSLAACLRPLDNWMRMRMANRHWSVLSPGHNNLHRTAAIISVGGFDEQFVAEDIAITLKLAHAGYTSKVMKLLSYDAEPCDIFSYTRRLARWAKQNIEIHRANWIGIPVGMKFQLFKLNIAYAGSFFLWAWAILFAWYGNSVQQQVMEFHGAAIQSHRFSLGQYVTAWMLPAALILCRIPLLVRLKISIKRYFLHVILLHSVYLYTLFALCWAQLIALGKEQADFQVTHKNPRNTTLFQVVFFQWYLLPFAAFLLAGLAHDSIRLLLFAPYLGALVLSPIVIYFFCKDRGDGKTKGLIAE